MAKFVSQNNLDYFWNKIKEPVNFAKEEYEKSLNLYNKDTAWIGGANNQNVFCNIYGLDVGTYTFNVSNYTWGEVVLYNRSNNVITRFGGQESSKIITFTTTNDTYYAQVIFYGNGTNLSLSSIDFTKIMLNKGSIPLPYQPYQGGEFVQLGNIKGIEIWSGNEDGHITYDATGYDSVEIIYRDDSNTYNRIKVDLEEMNNVYLASGTSYGGDMYLAYKNVSVSRTGITVNGYNQIVCNSGNIYFQNTNKIFIQKVIGYKEV